MPGTTVFSPSIPSPRETDNGAPIAVRQLQVGDDGVERESIPDRLFERLHRVRYEVGLGEFVSAPLEVPGLRSVS